MRHPGERLLDERVDIQAGLGIHGLGQCGVRRRSTWHEQRAAVVVGRRGQFEGADRPGLVGDLLLVGADERPKDRHRGHSVHHGDVVEGLRGDLPEGSITNTLDIALEDCVLIFGRWAYVLGAVESGATVEIDARLRRTELKTFLTGRRIVFDRQTDKFQHELTPYNPASTRVDDVLRMMMFFEAAGGRRYTGLVNHYQSFVDLSGLLRADRALLIARAPSDAAARRFGAAWMRDGRSLGRPDDGHAVYFRFVFPVNRQDP